MHDRFNSATEGIDGQLFLRYGRWPGSQALDLPPPEGLVAEEGTDNARFSGQQPGGSGAASAMVDDGTDPRKQPAVGSGIDEHDGFRQ